MMTPDQLQAALQDRRIDKVAEATGIHYNTVRRVARGEARNPTWDTIRRLSDYLKGEE